MKRVRLTLCYDGTRYHGWQKQNNAPTIQGAVEESWTRLTGEKVTLQGASRTDAGVHALGQVAHVDTQTKIAGEKLGHALNALLPDDIGVVEAEEVPANFHARFDAQEKWYRYRVLNRPGKAIFERQVTYQVEKKIDIDKMRQAASFLIGKHDFSSFKTLSPQTEEQDPVRTLNSLEIEPRGDEIEFDLKAKSFLYKMVRGIVGSLLEVGRGRFAPSWIAEALEKRDRTAGGPNAPAHGLYLMQVSYEGKEIDRRVKDLIRFWPLLVRQDESNDDLSA